MSAHIQKWGNSMAVRIPAHLVRSWGISEGQAVVLDVKDGALMVKPVQKRYSLTELLAQCTPENMALSPEDRDWLHAPAVGKEVF